jgi:hypothetical protein
MDYSFARNCIIPGWVYAAKTRRGFYSLEKMLELGEWKLACERANEKRKKALEAKDKGKPKKEKKKPGGKKAPQAPALEPPAKKKGGRKAAPLSSLEPKAKREEERISIFKTRCSCGGFVELRQIAVAAEDHEFVTEGTCPSCGSYARIKSGSEREGFEIAAIELNPVQLSA